MRIAMFCDYFHPNLGGTQDSALLLAKGLAARGHTIDIYAPFYPAKEYARASLPVAEINAGPKINIRRLPSIPWFPTLYRLALPQVEPWKHTLEALPDIIHVHTIFMLGFAGRWSARRSNMPLIATDHLAMELHAAYVPPLLLRLLARWICWLLNSCDFVSAPAAFVFQELGDGAINTPHAVISNPVDLSAFTVLATAQRAQLRKKFRLQGPAAVYAGRLVREKSLDVLLQAMAILLKEVPDAVLLIAGDGDMRPEFETLAAKLGIAHAIRFMGTLDKSQLAELFNAADLFVSMSLSETQGLARLQAMACGAPAVAARSAATPTEEPGMRLIAPRDAHQCAAVVAELLRSESTREHLGIQARRHVEQFSVEIVAQRWEEVYVEAIERRGSKRGTR